MTTEDKDRKKLSLSSGGTLSLGKTIETSQVKQSFSHGRSKTVQVERRRKRVAIVSNDIKDVEALDENAPQNLTSEERAARTRALQVGLKQTDGTSEEVSSLVAFLCTNSASYINGTSIEVDGGSAGHI